MSTHQNKKTISWQALEYRHYQKNAAWYVTLGALAILVIGFFVIINDLFAAITMGIITLFVIFFSRLTPKVVDIELSHKGIRFDNLIYPYKQLKYFWVVNNQNHKTVNFHTTTLINNTVILELEQQDPDEVREFLLSFLPEHDEVNETPIQKITHKLKF